MKKYLNLFTLSIILLTIFSNIELAAHSKTFFSSQSVAKEKELFSKIESATELKNYRYLGQLFKKISNSASTLQKIEQIATKHGATHLLAALEATKTIQKLGMKHLKLTSSEFLQTALFIEAVLPELIRRKQFYLQKEKTHIPFSVEYDPKTKKIFIVLPENNKTRLGSGANKIVTKSILYSTSKPEVVARGLQTGIKKAELQITRKFQGAQGIMEVIACTKYKDKGITYQAIYSKFYNGGSLSHALKNHCTFSLYEKMGIALNILRGLKELHHENIAHFDIAAANCLIEIPPGEVGKRNIIAVISDLGRANTIVTPLNKKLRVQGRPVYTPPEGIFREKMKEQDYCYSDVYAIGCIFYRLFYNKPASWQDSKYVKDKTTPKDMLYREFVNKIKKHTSQRLSELARSLKNEEKSQLEHRSDAFEYLILRMVDPEPKNRGTAAALYEELKKVVESQQ